MVTGVGVALGTDTQTDIKKIKKDSALKFEIALHRGMDLE
jgi:hypothetical protein